MGTTSLATGVRRRTARHAWVRPSRSCSRAPARATRSRGTSSCAATCRWPAAWPAGIDAEASPSDDLMQVASVALVKALARFDHERGVAFPSYAVPTIVGELKRHLRDTPWSAHVSQRMRERVLEVDRTAEALRRALGRRRRSRRWRVESARQPTRSRRRPGRDRLRRRLAGFAGDGAGSEHGPSIADSIGFEEERYDLVEYGVTIDAAIRALPVRSG